ncbi:response regulator [bacterium]|nr:response regulator [bacterium]
MKERKLLLVEDDELTRLLVHKGLEQLGYQVSSVGSVPEALCAFHQTQFRWCCQILK